MHNAISHGDPQGMGVARMPADISTEMDGIVTIDEAMRIVMVNPTAQRMFGRTAPQLLGSDLSVLIPPAAQAAHAAQARQFMMSGVTERPLHGRGLLAGLRANGETFPLRAAICRMDVSSHPGGKRYYTAVLRDVGHERRAPATIKELNSHLCSLLELLPVGVWVTEGEQVVYANAVCARLFGVELGASLTGRSIYELLDPQVHDLVRRKVSRVPAHQDEALPVLAPIARADGSFRCVVMLVAVLPDPSRTLIQMVMSDVTTQAQECKELQSSRNVLRHLNSSVVDAREEERRSIARELHDELGQRMTVLKLELESLHRAASGIPPERMRSMLDMVDDAVAATRRIAMRLRPLMLDDLGLQAAIEWLAREFERTAGLQVALRFGAIPDAIPQKVMITLYRTVQEALTNIARHSGGDRVTITLSRNGAFIELLVDDNGRGFSETPGEAPNGSFGLLGIRERVTMLRGQLTVSNLADGGARVALSLPLDGVDNETGVP